MKGITMVLALVLLMACPGKAQAQTPEHWRGTVASFFASVLVKGQPAVMHTLAPPVVEPAAAPTTGLKPRGAGLSGLLGATKPKPRSSGLKNFFCRRG